MAVAVAAVLLPPAAARRSSLSSRRSPFAAPISIHVPRRAPPPCPRSCPLPQRSRLVVASAQFDFARGLYKEEVQTQIKEGVSVLLSLACQMLATQQGGAPRLALLPAAAEDAPDDQDQSANRQINGDEA